MSARIATFGITAIGKTGHPDKENLMANENKTTGELFEFEPIKGFPLLQWRGKRPFQSTQYYPAQPKEIHGEAVKGWLNEIYWGDNLQVMSHLLKKYRGQVKLVYIDPPFDSKADYKKKIELKGEKIENEYTPFEEKQYGDIWTNDEYLQFMYERLLLIRELLADNGSIYLHCDYRKSHELRCLMDEVFGRDNFLNQIVWMFSTRSSIKSTWKRSHHDILYYKKSNDPTFNWDDDMVIEPLSESTIKKYKYEDENGRYRLNGRNIKGSPVKSAKDVDPVFEKTHPELVVRDYLREGKVANDFFFIDIENQVSSNRTDYPTQKPEELLFKLLSASTRPGDLVFDCFMGSGTTHAVAMKLGRRFIGADINLGSIQETTKRLLNVRQEIIKVPPKLTWSEGKIDIFYTGFKVFTVNHYEVFRNPDEAKRILLEAYGIQPLPSGTMFDGELDGFMVKLMPVNRIATRADLNEIVSNVDRKTLSRRRNDAPGEPQERILLICMGHEPDLAAVLRQEFAKEKYDVEVKVADILKDKAELEFKRESEAKVSRKKAHIVIERFYPMNLLQK